MRRPPTTVRVAAALLCVAATAMVAGCSSTPDPPKVSFTVAGNTASTGPTQYCDVNVTDCTNHADAVVTLRVPAGTPVQIAVATEVSDAPWQVVFRYLTTAGDQVDGRSSVFAPGKQHDFTLQLPVATDKLQTAQVQQFGARPVADENGQVSFPIRGSWVLAVGS